jgi:segregation and condensation protein B
MTAGETTPAADPAQDDSEPAAQPQQADDRAEEIQPAQAPHPNGDLDLDPAPEQVGEASKEPASAQPRPEGDPEPVSEQVVDGPEEPPAALELPLAMMVESLLLVADEPVTDMLLAELTGVPQAAVDAELHRLAAEYGDQGRGFDLRQVAGGWRLYTRAECAGLVERFVLRGQTARMTQAALETLAVVAYRQPVSRGRVAAVRGVNVDGVIRTLLSRGLIDERGSDPESSATLYGTTDLFLERLGLRNLEELPSLAPLLPDLESLEFGQDSIST